MTRADMKAAGWSPSVRLFEAAACGCPIVSDSWAGIEEVLHPERELALADDTKTMLRVLERDEAERREIGAAARRRVLAAHRAGHRAGQLERYVAEVAQAPSATAA